MGLLLKYVHEAKGWMNEMFVYQTEERDHFNGIGMEHDSYKIKKIKRGQWQLMTKYEDNED